MMMFMLRRIVILLVLALIVIGAWLWFASQDLRKNEADVASAFSDVVTYYVELRQQYVVPLKSISELTDADKASIDQMAGALEKLGSASSLDQKYSSLLEAQKILFGAVTQRDFSEVVLTEPKFEDLSIHATTRGRVSELLNIYNQRLALYRGSINTPSGKLVKSWFSWPYLQYLNVDGTTTTETVVRF
jgi:hypothetical protein